MHQGDDFRAAYVTYDVCSIYSNAPETYSITEVNTMSPEQTAPSGSILLAMYATKVH